MLTTIVIPMLIGFSVFMIGMKTMELGLHRSVGRHLDAVLKRSTATPIHGLLVGTAATAVLQSSTAVTVMSIGLVNTGLLTFSRTLGIILGTNIGTCLTTELLGLNLSRIAWPLFEASLALWTVTVLLGEMGLLAAARSLRRTSAVPLGGLGGGGKSAPGKPQAGSGGWLQPLRSGALILGGFAMLLIGIGLMQAIGPAVESSALFRLFLGHAGDSVLWGLAAGFVLTAIVHSSAAVIGIMMGLAAVGAMPVEIGIAIVLGSNVGTCVTALLASIGGTKSGRFVAWSHLLLNVGGAALFTPLVGQLHAVSAWLSDSPAAQIAHAQTIFNIACSLLALPVCYHPRLRESSPQ
ncbi:Na/Pi cotransporter family protein [Paenibacillus humicola]|uniref:Na/Pi cotransporter family protein n=1 Tax=Paenibacillus humicola TaxID=3110540 RepID=UPI00237C40A6|nr:Na/Pi symporter [Paenibacillus humicola]